MDESTLSMGGGEFQPAAGAAALSWGPFRLLEKVGQGAFGEVYRAWDPKLEREVALKLLISRGEDIEAQAKSILREARQIARVRHPNVVSVYGVDRFDGRVGFWSDFVRGKTLTSLMKTHGPFGYQEAGLIGIELCRAVSAVHAAGLLHRDIKAGNVMREEGGRILLMDFGLTGERSGGPQSSGTPAYMAPEILAGEPATVASDVYALGVLLFHLVTGKHPVTGTSVLAMRAAHESGSRLNLMDERPDLPPRFTRAIETALDRDPGKRYATAGQMMASLSDAAGVEVVSRRPKRRLWLVAPVLPLAALAVWLTPLRNRVLPGIASVSGAHADYFKAQDLLDRYYKPHNLDNAIPLFEKAIKEDPKFAMAYAGLGRAYWQQYRDTTNTKLLEPAQNASAQALALNSNLASAHVTLGMIYTQTGRSDLAAQELDEALRLDSRNSEAYGALGELYAKQGRKDDIEPTFQKAADLAPADWRWPNFLGNYYLTAGKLDAAVEQFQQLVKLAPDNSRVYNNLGIAYRRQGRLSEARSAYEKSIALEPRFSAYLNLGVVLQQSGQNAEAVPVYERAVELNPSSYLAISNLASAYGRLPGQEAKSRETYRKAITVAEERRKKTPNDGAVLADLGAFYAATGETDKAVAALRQAAAWSPDNPQILYRVAEGYELLHRREDALRWLRKALAEGLSRETVERNPELAALRADKRYAAALARTP